MKYAQNTTFHNPSYCRQDDDVLDTWFSSGLWTFGTLGWPENTQRLQQFHPTDVLVTGFDIIFFWVARMIMMTMHLMKDENNQPQVPFKTVYVTGLIRDDHGQKMSKSKGNVIDPLDMIDGIELNKLLKKRTGNMMQPQLAEKIAKRTKKEFPEGINAHGTDALRFTLTALASTGRDINWDMKRLEGYRNFCNKLWNASRYVMMNTVGEEALDATEKGSSVIITDDMLAACGANEENVELSLADRWIISRLQQAIKDIRHNFDNYRFDLASKTLYDFVWNEYCSWYLELSKPVLSNDNASKEAKRGTRRTLIRVLESILRLAHPIIPFITEEIWQQIKPLANINSNTIMMAEYPCYDETQIDVQAENDIVWLQTIIEGLRNIRGEMNIPPSKAIPVLLKNSSEQDRLRLHSNQNFLITLAKLDSITVLSDDNEVPLSATALVNDMQILVPMAGLINKEAEAARLNKEIEKLQKELSRINGKLNNPKFVDKAPTEVVNIRKGKTSQPATGSK